MLFFLSSGTYLIKWEVKLRPSYTDESLQDHIRAIRDSYDVLALMWLSSNSLHIVSYLRKHTIVDKGGEI